MRVLSIELHNFGSYKHLQLDLTEIGLALIQGPTGAGKSTILDAVSWILYGVTSKNGAVDEVRSWQAMEAPTTGSAWVSVGGRTVEITRIRGGNSAANDLYYSFVGHSVPQRGKDLADTQRRITDLLAVSADTYLTGAYFHEFSPHGAFFQANAKTRRQLFERIAPLELASKLAERAKDARKASKDALAEAQKTHAVASAKLEHIDYSLADIKDRIRQWDVSQAEKIESLRRRRDNFDRQNSQEFQALEGKVRAWEEETNNETRDLLAEISDLEGRIGPASQTQQNLDLLKTAPRCATCGAQSTQYTEAVSRLEKQLAVDTANFYSKRSQLHQLAKKINPYSPGLYKINTRINMFGVAVEEAKREVNPFRAQLDKTVDEAVKAKADVQEAVYQTSGLVVRVSQLHQLHDISFDLRGRLLRRAVAEIEASTNKYLHDYFDSEIRASFTMNNADELEIELQKSGYSCVYTQLSKGQRSMLKLSFGVSVMAAAANAAGTHFDVLMFDEALDGLDPALKVKAFRLFESLAKDHPTVLVIDHAPELQDLFPTRLTVEMSEDHSVLARDP